MSLEIWEKIDKDLKTLTDFHEAEVKRLLKEGKTTRLIKWKIEGLSDAHKLVLRCFREAGVV